MDSLVVLHLINLCTAEIITSQAILSMRVVIWICCNVYYFENLIYTHTINIQVRTVLAVFEVCTGNLSLLEECWNFQYLGMFSILLLF